MYIYRKSDGVDFGNDTRGHITTPLAKAKLMCASSNVTTQWAYDGYGDTT